MMSMEHKPLGQSRRQPLSKRPIKMLIKVGPNGDPIATPFTSLYIYCQT